MASEKRRTSNSPVLYVHRFPGQLAEALLFTKTWIETILRFQMSTSPPTSASPTECPRGRKGERRFLKRL